MTREEAHQAFSRREWRAAYDGFRAIADSELDAADHDALAESAHWLGLHDEAIESYGQAYRYAGCDARRGTSVLR